MEQTNGWTRLLDGVLNTAGNVLPGVLGKQQTTSAGVPNASGTPASAPAKPDNSGLIKWTDRKSVV